MRPPLLPARWLPTVVYLWLIVANCSTFSTGCARSAGSEFLSEEAGWLLQVSVGPTWPLRPATLSH